MTMLLSELQTALNDVVVACLEAADGHEAAADILDHDPLAGVLRALAGKRREAAAALGDIVRGLGDLPPTPDTDLETVRELATRVKAALSPDQRLTLLAEREEAEARLVATVEQALTQPDLAAGTRPLLETLRDAARTAQQRLVPLRLHQ